MNAEARQAEADARARAVQDLADIRVLKRTPEFARYFQRRLDEVVGKQRTKVLEEDLDRDTLFIEKKIYTSVKEMAGMLERDARACRKLLGEQESDLVV